ncbi:MAG: DUF4830 domain-containing protein [Anaerolineae bacterium]|nr:DUF4830 domain-containing protein [Anaerolineae bacterium]
MKIKLTWLLLVCLCGGLLSGCSSPASQPLATNMSSATASPLPGTVTSPASQATATPIATADPYVALLEKYHWTPEGEPAVQPVTIRLVGTTNEPGFTLFLEASQAIGLDFTPRVGQEVQQRTYFLGHEPTVHSKIYGCLLVEEQQVIGACVSVERQRPGVHPLYASMESLVIPSITPGVDLLEKFGWEPQGDFTAQAVTIPRAEDLNRPDEPFRRYLEASEALGAGRDFTPWAGQEVYLRTYFLGHEPNANLKVYGHLLFDGPTAIVGGWVSVEGQTPGIHPLNTDIKNLVLSSPSTTGATEGFAFYFPAQEIATADILEIDLNNFELSDQPIISLDDIVTYSKNTHEIELAPAACERIRSLEVPVRGVPFVACVDRQPIYGGAFWVGYSSVSFNGIAINVLSCDQSHRIRIQLGYPESPELFVGEDYRADRRILQSLAAVDKLK